ncbi:helix-turn-helix domain-containing protein [Nannocystis pusilla]|uniref:helix-turn-helix domain-containing protein n=1 Tax=Nannocystis pusilla TaxID=889268 RepID=UPI003BEF66FA
MTPAPTHRIEPLPVAVPGVVALRSHSDQPYTGLKDTYMISRFEAGTSEFWTHGRAWEGRPGAVVVHEPGDVHRDVRRHGVVTYQMIRLSPGVVEQVTSRVRLQACLEPDDPRAAALHRLHDAVAGGADRFALECALAEAIDTIADVSVTRERAHAHTRPVRRALELIRERLAEPLTLDELAREAGLDKFHLCRAFRAQVGMPPHAYLTQLRIMHAKEMLAAGAKPKDIAPRVGLYDQSQLNRHFRRIVGMTPGQFARGL